ncbi:MAG: TetR/AcrR family transcriptional regulator [Bdellovibrionales bacterium]|nr:TetR/AcrR family transcriptional regulator [Bdellovibrionales bacterium]
MSKPRKRKPRGAYRHGDLRNALLAEALRLIQERGQVDFNLRELAKLAGVTHTAAYRHFRSKRELLAEIALAGYQRLLFLFQEAAFRAKESGTDPVLEQGKVYVRFAVENPGRFRAMVDPGLHPFIDFPDLYATAKATFASLVATIKEGIAAGRYRMASATRLALSAWASVHGLSHLILEQLVVDSMDPTPLDLEATLDFVGDFVARGFAREAR